MAGIMITNTPFLIIEILKGEPIMKCALVTLSLFFSLGLNCQVIETRYAIETIINKDPVAYENNIGSLKINSGSGDLNFLTDLATLKTGDKTVDSLLAEMGQIQFSFNGTLSQGLFGIINQQNDDKYHRVAGTVSVGSISYPAEAFVRINNLQDKADISKALLDFRMEINPSFINIPVLSEYFKNVLLFQVADGVINQNR